MRYLCLGYMDEATWDGLDASERHRFVAQCRAFGHELQTSGHGLLAETLAVDAAAVLTMENGCVSVADASHVNDELRGVLLLEAADLNHAIQLASQHPAIRLGARFELRPAAINE